tara:strand:+ start:1154 stop:1738 length:585 start_codon:yes stop_codon:yes gene_type:complete
MKTVGLFFGTFNPIHLGHLAIANFFSENKALQEVWLVVSPQSPFKQKQTLIENHHRLAMVKLAINGNPKLKVCTEEFNLPSPNYTIDSLQHLKKKYPNDQFTLILGQDNIVHFDRWKSYEQILDKFQIFIYPRSKSDEIPSKLLNHPNITYFDASLLEVSATEIRKGLKQNEVVAKWLPNGVDAYLKNNTLTDL